MNHAAPRILTVGALAAIGWVTGGPIVAGAFAAIAVSGLWLSACRHPGPLALLPSIVEADGTRLPARWCCHNCGHSWPAALDDGHAPVTRFAGFDQKKAADSARRATDLERRQRELAVRRAGYAPRLEAAAPARQNTTLKLERPPRPVAVRTRRAG
jgi:hypothetical protein